MCGIADGSKGVVCVIVICFTHWSVDDSLKSFFSKRVEHSLVFSVTVQFLGDIVDNHLFFYKSIFWKYEHGILLFICT